MSTIEDITEDQETSQSLLDQRFDVPDYDPDQPEPMVFHPQLVLAKASLAANMEAVDEIDRWAADPVYKKQLLEEAQREAEVQRETLLELRARALENYEQPGFQPPQGEWLARLDETKLLQLLDPSGDYAPEKVLEATTSLEEAKQQNKAREAENRSLNKVFIPAVTQHSYWPEYLLEAINDGTQNPTSSAGTLDGAKLNEVLKAYLDFKATVQIPGKVPLGKLFSELPDFVNISAMRSGTGYFRSRQCSLGSL